MGTISNWESGTFIKTHDNISGLREGWVPLQTSPTLEDVGQKCDSLARLILNYKTPISGEIFLDHEIEWFKKEGEEDGPYNPNDFKQYAGHRNAGRYSFRSEFSKRYMDRKLKLEERIDEELASVFGRKSERKTQPTPNEVKSVTERVRSEFKYKEPPFSVQEANELLQIVERTYKQLKQGYDFEDEDQKRVYQKAKFDGDSLPLTYERLTQKKGVKDQAIESISTTFKDNWGVRESMKDFLQNKYTEYVQKYKNNIIRDEVEDQQKTFGVRLDEDWKTFYPKLYKTLQKNPNLLFQELIFLRFEAIYGKTMSGDWKGETLPAIQNIERMFNTTPEGHLKKNQLIKSFTNDHYSGGHHGAYAYYSPDQQRINFSDECMKYGTIYGDVKDEVEFRSVLSHEVGHAVEQKLGLRNYLPYRQFIVQCGWSYQQKNIDTFATGGDVRIQRLGSNSSIPLLTDYANVSPREAFAEYYSIYYMNQKRIDKYLETGNDKVLYDVERTIYPKKQTESEVGKENPRAHMDNQSVVQIDKELLHSNLEFEDHVKLTLSDPWESVPHPIEAKRLDKAGIIRHRKDYEMSTMPPVTVVRKAEKGMLIDGVNRQAQSKIKLKAMPTFEITPEFYQTLGHKGYTRDQIVDYVNTKMKDEKIPFQEGEPKKLHGLEYRETILPVDAIKRNIGAIRKMREIYHSEVLQKALDDLELSFTRWEVIEDQFNNDKVGVETFQEVFEDLLQKGQLVIGKQVQHKEKEEKKEEKKDPSIHEGSSHGLTEKELSVWAKNCSEEHLKRTIKHSNDEKLRQAAHKELQRREKDEEGIIEKGRVVPIGTKNKYGEIKTIDGWVYEKKDKEDNTKQVVVKTKKEPKVTISSKSPEFQELFKTKNWRYYYVKGLTFVPDIEKTKPYRELHLVPTIDDYYLNTSTVFKTIPLGKYSDEELFEFLKEKGHDSTGVFDNSSRSFWSKEKTWDDLKKDKEHTLSPKSNSQYIVDRKTGDIYRYANHWNNCASCNWGLEKGKEGETPLPDGWDIGVSNIKDFKIGNTWGYGEDSPNIDSFVVDWNPEWLEKVGEVCKQEKEKLESFLKEKSLTDAAKKQINSSIESIQKVYQEWEIKNKERQVEDKLEKGRTGVPVGTINKYVEKKMEDGSWKYIKKEEQQQEQIQHKTTEKETQHKTEQSTDDLVHQYNLMNKNVTIYQSKIEEERLKDKPDIEKILAYEKRMFELKKILKKTLGLVSKLQKDKQAKEVAKIDIKQE